MSVQDAVQTYLFNTQLLDCSKSDTDKQFLLIAPTECQENTTVSQYLQEVVGSDAPINDVRFFNLRESMKNGGGPACLRLRIALNSHQLDSIQPRVLIDDGLYDDLRTWVNKHYRDRLTYDDLRDPDLLDELKTAASELEPILNLPGLYDLQ